MCLGFGRVRFCLDGIYFELPAHSLEELYQPMDLVPAVVLKNNATLVLPAVERDVSKDVQSGRRSRKVRKAEISSSSSSSSSSSGDDRRRRAAKKPIKERNDRPTAATPSVAEPASTTAKENSEEKSAAAESATQVKPKEKSGKGKAANNLKGSKAPPRNPLESSSKPSVTKKVRFADMVEEKTIHEDVDSISSDSDSSHESNESNTDPPPPIPRDEITSVEHPHNSREQVLWDAAQRASATAADLAASMNPDGPSDHIVPTQAGQPPAQRQPLSVQGSTYLRGRSPTSRSWTSSDLESNIDNGEGFARTRFHRQQALSPHDYAKTSRHGGLRSKRTKPDPVFIVRSRVYSTSSSQRASSLRRYAESDDSLRDQYKGKQGSSKKSALRNGAGIKPEVYRSPEVSNDVEDEDQLDVFTGTLFQDF